MGNLIGGRMAIEGRLARFVYVSLYRMHLIAIHGWLKGLALIAGRPCQSHHPAAAEAALGSEAPHHALAAGVGPALQAARPPDDAVQARVLVLALADRHAARLQGGATAPGRSGRSRPRSCRRARPGWAGRPPAASAASSRTPRPGPSGCRPGSTGRRASRGRRRSGAPCRAR